MRTACLTGWGQPADALKSIAPDAIHIDYTRHSSANAALLEITAQAREAHLLIGWSLGGQLALRAIATGMIAPKKLVLIAAPYQFVKSPVLPIGMPADTFATFKQNYANNPIATLNKAWALIAKDDDNAHHVRERLAAQDKEQLSHYPWEAWLTILEQYNCRNLYLDEAPETLIIHGDKDYVVYPQQSEKMLTILPKATLHTLKGCGHAPHWHNSQHIQELIAAHAHV